MLHILLFEPEIPPNTGNVIRLCANTGAHLHLIEPLGFTLDDAKLKRAGLDYHEWAHVSIHGSLQGACETSGTERLLGFSTRGGTCYSACSYRHGDALLFGPETRGLPADIWSGLPAEARLRIPMRSGSRSLNLSNAVAVVVYEAWRQLGFSGAAAADGG